MKNNRQIILLFLIILIAGCMQETKEVKKPIRTTELQKTIVVSEDLPLDNFNYQKVVKYFLVNGKDTSEFKPKLILFKEPQYLSLSFGLSYNKRLSQKEIQTNLPKILIKASKDFDYKLLENINVGRLIYLPDVAATISNDNHALFTEMEQLKTEKYDEISNIILKSRFVNQINDLLLPYSKQVSSVGIEKAFFIDKDDFLTKYTSDTVFVKGKVLDCITNLKIEDL